MKLDGKKLELHLKQPFLAVQEMSKTQNWCQAVDVLQTAAIAYHDDYNLKDLAETFELASDLIT